MRGQRDGHLPIIATLMNYDLIERLGEIVYANLGKLRSGNYGNSRLDSILIATG